MAPAKGPAHAIKKAPSDCRPCRGNCCGVFVTDADKTIGRSEYSHAQIYRATLLGDADYLVQFGVNAPSSVNGNQTGACGD
jgi:hypothetical protein